MEKIGRVYRDEETRARHERMRARGELLTRIRNDYWREVWKSHGFDIEDFKGTRPYDRMEVFMCKRNEYHPPLVTLYAKMGLHRYNMLEGTHWQLDHIQKYNVRGAPSASRPLDYFITLVARNPATGFLEPFQTCVRQGEWNKMDVKCCIARFKNLGTEGTFNRDVVNFQFGRFSVPKWPQDDALADGNRFYLVPESEWQENDWIRLYLELAFATTNRQIDNPKLSALSIVEVVVETNEKVQPPNELKGASDVILYIKYHQDLGDGGLCKRRAIVIRSLDLKTGRLSLMGGDYLDQPADSEHE